MTESQPSHKDWCLLLESNFSEAKWVITKRVCTLHLSGLHISEWMQHAEDIGTWFWTYYPLKPQSKLTSCKLPILGLHLCHCLDVDGPMTPVLNAPSLGWWIGSCWSLTDKALWMLPSWVVDHGVLKQMARWWLFSFPLCSWAQNGSPTFYDALSCHRPKAKSIHLKLEPLKSLLMFYYNFIFTDVLL